MRKTIKVLMFGWEFPPHNSGGLGVACKGLSEALSQKKDIEVCFVLPRKYPLDNPHLHFSFANIADRKISFRIVHQDIPAYPQHLFNSQKEIIDYTQNLIDQVNQYERAAAEIAKKEDFDIIHTHDWLSFGAGVTAKEVSGKPLVSHVHATEFDRSGGNGVNEFIYEKEKKGLANSDKVLPVSQYTKEVLIEKYGIDPRRITVVHNGVNIKEMSVQGKEMDNAISRLKNSGTKIVLFVGRLTVQKNPEALLHSAKRTLRYLDNVVFVYVGSGELQSKLIELAADLGISDKILFTGFLRGDEKKLLFKHADLFIMPSVSEPFGIVSLEAMAARTPVLMSKQSGVSYALRNVLKVDFWDIEEMANKMVAVLMYKSLQRTLSKNGYREVRDYTWDNAAEKCVEVYLKMLD